MRIGDPAGERRGRGARLSEHRCDRGSWGGGGGGGGGRGGGGGGAVGTSSSGVAGHYKCNDMITVASTVKHTSEGREELGIAT